MGSHSTEVILKFVDQFSSGFSKTIQKIESGTLVSKKTINSLNQVGTQMMTVGTMMFVPLAAGIKKCVDVEYEYENAVAKVKTIADESQKSMADIGKEMQKISTTYGQNISDVADTFYNVISATVDTANAIDYVNVASNMAIGGFADMNTAVGGLTSAMASYSKMGYDMYRIGDLFAQTQVYGKTTINELAETLGAVLPFASNVGMSFEDLSAVMAVLTSNGLDTALAATAFKNAISSILSPTASAVKVFDELGVAYGSTAFSDMDFGTYLDKLKDAVGLTSKAQVELEELMKDENVTDEQLTEFFSNAGVNIDKLMEMFGNIRGATAMLSLVGNTNKYHTFREQMNLENSKGTLERQANIMLESPEMQSKILMQNLNEGLRKFGEKMTPKVNQLLDLANNMLTKLNGLSDEQISQIVDNVIKIAAASASLIILGTIAKSLASILTLANTIWKPLSKVVFGKLGVNALGKTVGNTVGSTVANTVGGTTGNAVANTVGGASATAGMSAIAKIPLIGTAAAMAGTVVSGTIGGIKDWFFDNRDETAKKRAEEIKNDKSIDPMQRMRLISQLKSWGYDENGNKIVYDNPKEYEKTEINNTTNITEKKGEVAYEKYDPESNKFTTVYVSNVNVSGVDDLDSIIKDIEKASSSMR